MMTTGSKSTTPPSSSPESDASTGHTARRLREKSHATQDEVAQALDLPVADYRRFEEGLARLSPLRLVRLARLLGVTVEHLLVPGYDGHPLDVPTFDAEVAQLLALFAQMDAAKRRECLAFAETLALA